MSERNKASIRSTNVEGIFDMMIRPTGSETFIDKVGLTAVEVCDYLFSGPLVDFFEFDINGNAVNHAAIHAEAQRRGKSKCLREHDERQPFMSGMRSSLDKCVSASERSRCTRQSQSD